jgi:cellulose biosynthesis protein BcsQ
MSDPRQPLAGLRIVFLGKGGSAKSTALVLVAEALRRHEYEVCVLDVSGG